MQTGHCAGEAGEEPTRAAGRTHLGIRTRRPSISTSHFINGETEAREGLGWPEVTLQRPSYTPSQDPVMEQTCSLRGRLRESENSQRIRTESPILGEILDS